MTEVGCSWAGLDYATFVLQFIYSKNVLEHWAGIQLGLQVEACNQGAAVEVDAIG